MTHHRVTSCLSRHAHISYDVRRHTFGFDPDFLFPILNPDQCTRPCMTCSLTAQGKWSVPHFTAKGRVEAYVKEAHASMAAAFLAPGFFYSNFVERFPSRCERLHLCGAVSQTGV